MAISHGNQELPIPKASLHMAEDATPLNVAYRDRAWCTLILALSAIRFHKTLD
jgi:hypothetical protein